MFIDELINWENDSSVLDFKFQQSRILIWPYIRYGIFSKILENRFNLQQPYVHASLRKLKIIDKLSYLFRTIKDNPFTIKRDFDILFFSSTLGVSEKINGKWFGRINDYFALEYNDRTLVLDSSSDLHYRFPRFPGNVKCHDFINLCTSLKSRVFKKISIKDSDTIKRLISMLRESWKGALKESDYISIENSLIKVSASLNHLQDYYTKLFKLIKPKILFIENASYGDIYAWIIKWAKERGIVTCEFQHGCCISLPYVYGDKLFHDKEYKNYLPDHLLLYGKYWDGLIRSSSKKIIIGNPHFDAKKKQLGSIKRSDKAKTILVVSQWIITDILVDLAFQLSKMSDPAKFKIIFRLHPVEVPLTDRYSKLKGIKNIEIDGDRDIYALMSESDYIVGCSSFALFEAACLNKKVYVLENSESAAYVPKDIGLRFRDANDLFDLIEKDVYKLTEDRKIFFADGWRENYRNFINPMLEKQVGIKK